ncbi:exopolysaccharide biosynthesis polyprenyl glycosylphosphotransferase [Pseudarthrobacter chlorophenolicus A6]|uniref:Exopolysaccharide biosynthesis polyprenyl glycosylphosphotransferase n=1 Tax=Pseudarthrobacter chlorophenolicus (strain ATCC 700700 / DSM 12829 / CIP 107037 / JCM 12360 / KCTC 9906 / NCIMB 13794 / A6) TaxID=452863 RepID=B8HEG5_PSECP|nr:sugar transferase [Pseudarthrobacter chlorophenolicus]ACL40910.1 exopolysaccharide biosynthesis polyprenyl glycosylphosphotransferase [Pseudarthrobacter chlorophenolicus A6]SDQ73055.1 exopolysaccharide biosynthesis polyprenyl glycosylphosphotransferase [Pseudarthrobacter chlorophenolicus]
MRGKDDWRGRTSRLLGTVDALVIAWAVVGAYIVRFGVEPGFVVEGQEISYVWLSALLGATWWLMLGAWSSRQSRILGAGPDEYKRVAAASLWLFGLLAIVSYALRIDTARGYVGIALPVGLGGLLLARWLLRQHLNVDRQKGRSMSRLLLLGGPGAIAHLASSLNGAKHAGYLPVAAYSPGLHESLKIEPDSGLQILGQQTSASAILDAIDACKADAVAVSAGVQLHPQTLRHLGWELAARNVSLIMAPALTDIAGPRIHTQQVAGLPLMHVTTPTLEGGQQVAKRLFDLLVSGLLIIAFSPLMLVLALIVKLDSPGPILFRQERVGIEGLPFRMLKFRSMVVDAEERLQSLIDQNEGNGLLFKMKDDPRITRTGRALRKFSLDELPQLFNIFAGSMSLVGPRPPLPSEVEAYEHDVRRRLLVKPGLTGLWQVSGRSNLSWQDSVRLDLYYVENWSLAGDLLILLRTVRAVFQSSGAY